MYNKNQQIDFDVRDSSSFHPLEIVCRPQRQVGENVMMHCLTPRKLAHFFLLLH